MAETNEKERMKVDISRDNMLAHAIFYRPSGEGELMTEDEIRQGLKEAGVKEGIQEEAIQNFLQNREYGRNLLFAKGTPPVQGNDGRVEYLFNTNPNRRPKKNEDGSVDYRELNTINHAAVGQCVAKLIKETPGESGRTVSGKEVPPKKTKPARFQYMNNRNVEVSEDGSMLCSLVDGHVTLRDGKVLVLAVYEVPQDVDNTTGNIRFNGDVVIKGNVKSGFQVRAKGDIIVEGVVEGAQLWAGDQVIVKRGIHGMGKGVIESGGNVITKFIENAKVISEGYVETESILYSTVLAKVDIRVSGKKGLISGGLVRAGNLIEAKDIGAEMGGSTRIEVGVDPEDRERYTKLQADFKQLNKELDRMRPILVTYSEKVGRKEKIDPAISKQVKRLAGEFKYKSDNLKEINEEFDILYQRMASMSNARVRIRGSIFPGVYVSVSDVGTTVRNTYSNCQFLKSQGEITIKPL